MDDRRYNQGATIRMTTDSGKPVFEVQGIVFDVWSQNLGGFKEMIKRSAWESADTSDIRGLLNHDPNFVLGRNKSGTMQMDLRSDSVWGIITPPDTQWARDLAVSMDRGDIDGSSFAFRTPKGGDKWDLTKSVAERTVHNFSIVRDVSIVTYPAYEQTTSKYTFRSLLDEVVEHPEIEVPDELRSRLEKMGLALPEVATAPTEDLTPEEVPVSTRGLYDRRARLLSLSVRMGDMNAGGSTYDVSFLKKMIGHHQMAIDMATEALSKASHAELKTLAQSILDTQSAEIKKMKAWEKAWS